MVVFMGYKERLLNKMTISKQNLDKEKIISIKHKGLFYNIRFSIIKIIKKFLRYGR